MEPLIVPVQQKPERESDRDPDDSSGSAGDTETQADSAPETRVLHPGEGGYDEALAEWDLQQNPDRAPAVSTASGRQQAMSLIHAIASSSDHAVAPEVAELNLDDPEACAEALRHVLIGGVHSVEAFAEEVAEAEGGDPLSAHETAKIIGEVLAELD